MTDIFGGGGAMGVRMRALEWADTPLGAPDTWPQSLRSAVGICLNSRFPIAIYWGPQLALLYNDAWSPILGEKHPWALGRPGQAVWPEIWNEIGPLFETVQQSREGVWQQDQLLPMYRHGYTEECYFNFTFSPIRGEDGAVAGVFNAVIETTFQVIEERRARILRELSERMASAKSAVEVCARAAEVLDTSAADVPFCLFYLGEQAAAPLRLAAAAGTALPEWLCPPSIDPASHAAPWPLETALGAGRIAVLDRLGERIGIALPSRAWPEAIEHAAIAPLAGGQASELIGVLIVGVSPRRVLDEGYQAFIERITLQVATAIGNAEAYQTERRRAEALADIDRAKTAFFSNISHEFRTPLALLLGPLEDMLQQTDRALLPAEREQLELAHRNALRLLKLVNALLDFSRIEAGRLEAAYEPTDLAALTADLASAFRSAIERAGLRYIVDCPPLDELVYVDRELWEKIVFNLISNAYKFTFAGEIEVRLRQSGGQVELIVRDTGTGIPAEELAHLFERFHRVSGARGRSVEGSGIGLALVQELVKLHGGIVQVASEVDRGTVFTVTIPAGAAHAPANRPGEAQAVAPLALRSEIYVAEALRWLPSSEDSELPGQSDGARQRAPASDPAAERARILLADDNADMRDYLLRLLSQQHSVVAVGDGAAALRAANEQAFDMVLTDVMMPQLDGFGLLAALRAGERTRTLPVILLSARAGEEARVEGLRAGADDYITKPFSARELLARVDSHLAMARLRREMEQRLALIGQATNDALYDWDFRTSRVWVNAAYIQAFGPPPADVMADIQDWSERIHPDERLQTIRSLGEAMTSNTQTWAAEYHMRRADGVYTYVLDRMAIVRDAHGQALRASGALLDLTQRKQAEERLRHLQAVTASLAEAQTLAEVRRVVLGEVMRAIGADGGALRRVTDQALVVDDHERGPHIREESVRQFRSVPMSARHPAADAARSGEAVFIRDADELAARYPNLAEAAAGDRRVAHAHLPLKHADQIVAVLTISFTELHDWDEAERAFALTLAERAAAAYERAQLYETLTASEQQLRLLTDAMPALISYVDRDRRYQFVNKTYSDWFGHRHDEVVGRYLWDVLGQSAYEGIKPDIEKALAGQQVTYERFLPYQHGGSRFVQATYIPHRAASGEVLGVFALIIDLTERKRQELSAALLAEIGDDLARMADLDTMMHATGAKIGRHLAISRVLFVEIDQPNRQTIVLHDWSDEDLPGAAGTYRMVDNGAEELVRALAAGPVVIDDIERGPLAAGAAARLAELGIGALLAAPYHSEGGIKYALVAQHRLARHWRDDEIALIRELSARIWIRVERARAERERDRLLVREQMLRQDAEHANRLKDEFLATVSHELRTPLTAFLGYAQMLQLRKRDEAYVERTVEKMVRSATAQAQIIEDLLDISRIVSGKLHIAPEPIELAAVINAALDTVRPALDAKAIHLDMYLSPAASVVIGDANRLQQVVWNLLSNAVKFTPPGGMVVVELVEHAREARLTIRDTGQGIRPDFLPYVFERFRQADSSANRIHNGLGLGLAIVRHLVELHGGTVHAESAGEGQGASFTVRLPLLSAGPAPGAREAPGDATAAPGCPPELARLRVLLVDDQPDILDALREMLAICGAVVRTCQSAREALEAVRSWRPDVLVSDLAMPDDDGYWLIHSIRALPPQAGGATPAAALTAYVRMEDRLRVLAAGFQYYVPKPVEPAELRDVVARLARMVITD